MECPKCGGGCLLSEEDLVQLLPDREAVRAVVKALYVCRACAEKFSRLFVEDLARRKRPQESRASPAAAAPSPAKDEAEIAEGLKFF
ncbi:MAG: hypothetical protein HY520_00070 [Candidatus Aenigmarchaeota archaeon]|nr:hypothetical protein [Candidatus Aenigmarchaeota archaeon]